MRKSKAKEAAAKLTQAELFDLKVQTLVEYFEARRPRPTDLTEPADKTRHTNKPEAA